MTKLDARKHAREEVRKMTDDEKDLASGAICDALSSIAEFKSAKKPFIFLGTDGEPDTNEIVGLSLMLERAVSVPRVKDGEMQAILITPYTNFKKNRWGILEPVRSHAVDDIDVAIVPLVAFDGLKRVGHGGGYYDRFLSKHDCFKIGIAFDCQSVENLDVESFDVPLDMLVTEKRIITEDKEIPNEYYFE